MKPRIYIAGPISRGDLAHNIAQAERAFYALLRAGFAPFCPHWSCYGGGPRITPSGTVYAIAERTPAGTTHDDWIGADLPWVGVSDAVLRLPGESSGADLETAEADRLGIPVFGDVAAVIQWAQQRRRAELLDPIPEALPSAGWLYMVGEAAG